MTIVTSFDYWVGDIVVDTISGELYEVKKINPKNVRCVAADGRQWNIDARRVEKANAQQTESFRGQVFQRETEVELLRVGHVVKFKSPSGAISQGLFVVTKENEGGFNIVNLGGNVKRQFFRSVPASQLEKVDGVITVTNV